MLIREPVFVHRGPLSVIQFRTPDADALKYVSLRIALRKGSIAVKEVSESGSVNNLTVENNSDTFVFISDGDLLEGAKQNRMLNTSVLLKPHSVTVIPVSCVEAGRWRFKSRTFSEPMFYAPSGLRRGKIDEVSANLKMNQFHSADQGKVWSTVDEYQNRKGVRSGSSDFVEVSRNSDFEFRREINDILPESGKNGAAIFIGESLVCIEAFNRCDVYAEYFPKLLQAACMDSDVFHSRKHLNEAKAIEMLHTAGEKINRLEFESHKAVSAGREKRFAGDGISCYELLYDDISIHFAALFTPEVMTEEVYRDSRGRIIINTGRYKGLRFDDILRRDYFQALNLIIELDVSDQIRRELFEEVLRFRNRY